MMELCYVWVVGVAVCCIHLLDLVERFTGKVVFFPYVNYVSIRTALM